MSKDYGKMMGNAIKAVARMHSDTSKLLQDCDGTIGKGRESVFGNNATRDVTSLVKAEMWMAEGVYRYYDASDKRKGLVDGITACFHDVEKHSLVEPLLIFGRIQYHLDADDAIRDVCKGWDLWYALIDWADPFELHQVLTPVPPELDADRIEWLRLIAVPLYSVKSMDDVVRLMKTVREHSN
jgi:hypothetical protein